jgi:hypothetical protein
MKPKDLQIIVDDHERFWENQRQNLVRYKSVYEMDFWEGEKNDSTQIRVQTNDGYGYIEGYQASLFAKNPSVVIKPGVRGMGHPKKAQGIANSFLQKSRTEIENASRMALIYPNAFVKMVPEDRDDVYERVTPVAVPPWEIIVDRDATRWDQQRYVGSMYWLPVSKAKERFGRSFSKEGVPQKGYFDEETPVDDPDNKLESESDLFKYIRVVEMYDLLEEKTYWWTPQSQDKWLDSEDLIPFKSATGRPVIPIVPFYYNRLSDKPLVGYSSIKRIYDQLYEMNVIRSFQANAVRKASRQWLVKKGALSAEEMSQVTSGVDGLFIEVDVEESLDTIIRPVPHENTPIEVSRYYQDVSQDKDKGSVIAPFTRGEVTKATATEIAALAAYTSSEIGRMARERDASIEQMASIYLSILGLYLGDTKEPTMVMMDGKPEVVAEEHVKGDFRIHASDQAATPISEAVHQQRLLQNIPVLQQLGVPQRALLEEVVRMLNLPETFLVEQPPPQQPMGGLPGVAKPERELSAAELIRNPSAANMSSVLPGAGEV